MNLKIALSQASFSRVGHGVVSMLVMELLSVHVKKTKVVSLFRNEEWDFSSDEELPFRLNFPSSSSSRRVTNLFSPKCKVALVDRAGHEKNHGQGHLVVGAPL